MEERNERMALFDFGSKKKFEELKKCLDEENYDAAVVIADKISLHKAKSISELNLLGKAYKQHDDFLLAKDFFERSYEQRCSRTVLMDLMDCCLQLKDVESTERYFNEYQKLVPEDKVTQYKYRYEIEKKKGRDRNLLIMILEELKVLEYLEEYAYELARQYHEAGRKQECINECKEIILWFGVGDSVERARILLAYYRGEISLDEVQSEGKYRPKQYQEPVVNTEEQEIDGWIAKKAEKLREEVRKIEEDVNFRDEVRKAEEAARAREAARRASEIKRVKEEAKRAEELKKAQEAEKEKKREKEAKYAEELKKAKEEAKRAEEVRRAEEIARSREELKRAEEAVARAKEEARRVEETIKAKEEIGYVKDTEATDTEQSQSMLTESEQELVSQEWTKEIAAEVEEVFLEESIKEQETIFSLPMGEVEISKVEHEELVKLLQKKQVSLSEILKSFGRVESIKQQVIHSLDISLKTKENSYFLLMGEPKSGKTTLGLSMIRLLFELGLVSYDRTATIDALQLNQISLKAYGNQLRNCNLIIEHAGSMTEKTVESLIAFFRENKEKNCLILEDSENKIKAMVTKEKDWSVLFYNQVVLPEYTTEELVGFAYDYITKEDYSIDSIAAKVLRDKIDEIVKTHGKESSLFYVMQLTKQILSRAEQRVSNVLLGMVSQGKIQIGNYLIVLKEDIL